MSTSGLGPDAEVDAGAAARDGPPPDRRLVLPAGALWVGAFAGTAATDLGRVLLAAAAVVASVAVGVGVAVSRRRSRRGLALVAMAAAVCGAAGATVGAMHRQASRPASLTALAASGAWVDVRATVRSDPRPVIRPAGSAREPSWVVPVRLRSVLGRGRLIRLRVPALVLAQHASWRQLLPGQELRTSGQLRPARAGQPVGAVLSVRGPPTAVTRPPAVQRAAGRLRAGLRDAATVLPRPERGLLPGLVVGDTSGMTPRLDDEFRAAGLTHLTAVSGANLAIVTGFVLLVARRLGVRGRWLPLLAAVAMAGFVVLARPQPSVVRAAVMGLVGLLALAGGRTRRSGAALAGSVVVLLLVDPWLSRSYGFALSVAATAGLVVLAPGWARALTERRVPRWLAHAISAPLAAQLACAPLLVLLSGQVSLVAVPANILAAPAVAPATVLGVLATVVSPLSETAARVLAGTAGVFVGWVVRVAGWAADRPMASIDWPGSVGGAVGLVLVLTVLVVGARHLSHRPAAAVLAATCIVVGCGALVTRPGWPPRDWLVAACDVGQGDAVVLRAGQRSAVVVDVGPEARAVDRCLRDLGVDVVPLVLLTHLHADHVGGLGGVLRRRRIGEVQVGPLDEPAGALAVVLRRSAAAGVPVTRTLVGDRERRGRVAWSVLWPQRVIRAGSVPNNASTVLLATVGGVTVLLTGDVELEAQQALRVGSGLGPVDVLKVAHHGSADQDPALLDVLRPAAALVSVGVDNDYGHPAPSTMRTLRRAGALIGRTDRDGTVVVAGRPGRLRLVGGGR